MTHRSETDEGNRRLNAERLDVYGGAHFHPLETRTFCTYRCHTKSTSYTPRNATTVPPKIPTLSRFISRCASTKSSDRIGANIPVSINTMKDTMLFDLHHDTRGRSRDPYGHDP